jgi:hypothetical protein
MEVRMQQDGVPLHPGVEQGGGEDETSLQRHKCIEYIKKQARLRTILAWHLCVCCVWESVWSI